MAFKTDSDDLTDDSSQTNDVKSDVSIRHNCGKHVTLSNFTDPKSVKAFLTDLA